MDADLVGAAGFGAELDQRQPLALRQLAPVGDGGLALLAPRSSASPSSALLILDSDSSIVPSSCLESGPRLCRDSVFSTCRASKAAEKRFSALGLRASSRQPEVS